MKPLRRFLDSLEPIFKDGWLQPLYPLYEAIDTFLYTPADVTSGPTHVRDAMDLKRMMSLVVVRPWPVHLHGDVQHRATGESRHSADGIGLTSVDGWRGTVLNAVGVGYDPRNLFACLVHGALYFIPVYLVTQIAGGFWELLFASVRKHEVNEGFLVTGHAVSADPAADDSTLAGRDRHQLRCACSVRRSSVAPGRTS